MPWQLMHSAHRIFKPLMCMHKPLSTPQCVLETAKNALPQYTSPRRNIDVHAQAPFHAPMCPRNRTRPSEHLGDMGLMFQNIAILTPRCSSLSVKNTSFQRTSPQLSYDVPEHRYSHTPMFFIIRKKHLVSENIASTFLRCL